MWSFRAIRPKSTCNWVPSPSFESLPDGTHASPWTIAGGASISSAQIWRGVRSLAFSGAGATICSQTVPIVNTTDTAVVSAYLYLPASPPTITLTCAKLDTTVLGQVAANASLTNQWQRLSAAVSSCGMTNTTVVLSIAAGGTVTGTMYIDAIMLENGTELSTYFDGDTPGCKWMGRPGLSPSWRPMDCRSGGVEVPLANYMSYVSMQGWGQPSFSNVVLPFGLQGGETYQRTIKQARTASIVGVVGTNASPAGYSLDYIHDMQAGLGKLLGADVSMPQKPVRLIYSSGATGGNDLSIDALYEGGNDAVVIPTGVRTRSVSNPSETADLIDELLAD